MLASSVTATFLEGIPAENLDDLVPPEDRYGETVLAAMSRLTALRELITGDPRRRVSPTWDNELQHRKEAADPRDEWPTLRSEALERAESATSLNPLSVMAWILLGDVHQLLGDFANAQRAWTNALTHEPDNPSL